MDFTHLWSRHSLLTATIILVVGFLHYTVLDQIPVIRFFLELAFGLVSLYWIGDTDDNDYVASLRPHSVSSLCSFLFLLFTPCPSPSS